MLAQQAYHLCQETLAVDTFILRIGVGKMIAYVAQTGRTQECIAYSMDKYIGIAMTLQAKVCGYLDASKP